MFYRSSAGVLRCLLFHLFMLFLVSSSMSVFIISGPYTVYIVAGIFSLGSFFCICRSLLQWYEPSIIEYNGLVYYKIGIFSKCLGKSNSLRMIKSILGDKFVCLKGDKSGITLYRSDYHLRRIRMVNRFRDHKPYK